MSASLHRRVAAIVARGTGGGSTNDLPGSGGSGVGGDQADERVRAIAGLGALQEIALQAQAQAQAQQDREDDSADPLSLLTAAAGGGGGGGGAGGSASLALHRSFRLLVQSRSVSVHRALLNEFAGVAQEMRALEASLDDSAALAQQLASQLRAMKVRSNELFQSSAALTAQQAALEGRKELVHTFLTQFQLDPADARVLNDTSEDAIGETFFAALQKITEKKRNIEAVLGGNANAATEWGPGTTPLASPHTQQHTLSGSHRISLDLLDSLTRQLETSYEKLYRYIQTQLTGQHVVKTSDLHSKFITSFQLLRNIPVYFQHCSGDLISARRSLLIERFLKALSRGSAGARPIELSAHDPVRYCSDMLAWIHQALANEKEFLSTLFPPTAAVPQQPPTSAKHTTASPDPTSTTTPPVVVHDYQIYLSSIFEALSRPLRVRIEQSFSNVSGGGSGGTAPVTVATAATHSQIETVFKIWNILKFYRVIIEPILPVAPVVERPKSPLDVALDAVPPSAATPTAAAASDLLSTLSLLGEHARASFFHLLGVAGERLTRTAGGPNAPLPADLALSPPVSEWLAQLRELVNIYNSALIAPAEKEEEFAGIIERVMEPLLACIGLSPSEPAPQANTAATPADVDRLIYRINVLHAVLNVCFTFPSFVSRRIETVNFLVQQQIDRLIDQQTRLVWQKANLDLVMQAMVGVAPGANLAAVPAITLGSLTSGIGAFYSALLSVGAFIVPQCDRLLHTPARRHCRFTIAKSLSAQYRQLYSGVMAPTSGFDQHQLASIFVHQPSHVDLLLDIGGTSTTPTSKAS